MRGGFLYGNREVPAVPGGRRPPGRSGKACGHDPDVYAAGTSDIGIVPGNVPNKAGSRDAGGYGGTGIPPHNRKGAAGHPPPGPVGDAPSCRLRRHGREGRRLRSLCLPEFPSLAIGSVPQFPLAFGEGRATLILQRAG
jgi:hypothetical protein